MPQDEFGGVAVEDTADEFGGVPVMDAPEPTEADAESILAGPEGEPAWVGPNGQRPNESALLPYNPSAWERFRNTRIGHSVFGPTDVEQQSELKPYNDPGVLPIARTLLKFTSVPPPLAEEIRTLTDPVLESPWLGETGQGIAKGLRETALTTPLAPFGAAGKVAMPLFAGEFAASVPEQKAEYKRALREGRTADAAKIATEFVAGSALTAAGTKHELGRTLDRFTPKETPNVEPKTEAATPGAATEAGAETETQTFVGDKPVEVLEINRQKKTALVRDANDPEAAPDVVKLSDLEEREVTKGGDNNASSEPEATTVYGDVRPQPGEGTGEVPAEEGSRRIQPETNRGVQPAEGQNREVSLKPAIRSQGTIVEGTMGKSHADLITEATKTGDPVKIMAAISGSNEGRGFVDQDGKFYTRKEAEAIMRKQHGDFDMIKPTEGLHSEDLNSEGKPKTLKGPNLPEWTREEMVKRGIDPNRTFNDVDLANPSVREAIQSDPTLSAAEKERLLSTGSLKEPVPGSASDEFGSIYGPKLNRAAIDKLRELEGESFDLPSPPGITTVLKVKSNKLWVESSKPVGNGLHDLGIAVMHIAPDGQTVLMAPRYKGRPLSKEAADALTTFLSELRPEKLAKAVPSEQPKLPSAPEVSVGPGGASPSDVGSEKSDMQALTQAIEGTASPKESISDRLAKAKEAVANLPGVGKNAIKRGLLRMQGIASAIKSALTTLPKFTTYKRILGQWNGANQIADHELRQFVKTIDRTIPQPKQEAMVNWIQADGNADVLRQRATDSNPKFRKGYEDALKLTKDEQTAARNISSYLDARLQAGIDAGLLQDGVEQYITQIWKRENPISRKLSGDFSTAKLQPNFKFARQRIFDSYFEGEQAGYEPANKTVSAVIAAYDQSFNRALASRAFVKNLTEGKASDSRPLVEVSGTGSAVPRGEAPEAILINPKIKGADLADYRTIDHPALRKWAWQTQAPDGTPVFLKGDLLVHPEIYQHLKNVLGTSAWRKNIVGRAVLGTESTLKQAMFSLSGFHQVQETLHALGHRVNPARLERINFSEPWQKEAVEHGLQVADYNALEKFGEGLNSGALINKIPLLGTKVMGPYTEWLFQDYIPRLKLTMYREALARNMNRYAKQLESGKITRDQIVENTAKQANAAFGELNYTWLGRNKTLQDTMRAFLVAPDFLEARSKFVGQAVRSHGREQLVALGILAATQYLTARIVNKINDDDPHWELKNAFSLVKGKHRYELRTIPGDLIHLIEDPHRFTTSRLAPIVRQSIEFVEGRDWRGVKRDAGEQIKDLAKVAVPISLKPYEGQRLWEAALNAFGVHETRYTAQDQIREKAQAFVKEHKGTQHQPEPTDEPTYGKLRAAVSNGNQSHAKDLLNELVKAHGPQRVFDTMESHVLRPFTESRLNEADFRNSLSEKDKALYDKARDERREEFRKFLELWYNRTK